ncbi:hypothetical protein PhaeoP72_02543 [Phaeobacter inhibens]|uniref:hypothetical protein n=1 Tax=Phaeobacter inhibens TaxID=221822 RepID=UPI000C9A4807|nr:hypothetical protein [Phaeobacter inhibens]AUR04501.1 hypothetical protein PhaeoP72_02543 [Phaeobacter inhibens]
MGFFADRSGLETFAGQSPIDVAKPMAAIIFIWSGAAIAGNLIAAPAKFQAPSLTLPVALDVGRMQFQWLGVAEAVCAFLVLALLLASKRMASWQLVAVFAAFALQRLWILPVLDERTLAIIAGQPVKESSLHLVYIAAEVVKAACLVWAGSQAMRPLSARSRVEDYLTQNTQ